MLVVQSLSRVQLFVIPHGLQHARLSCPSLFTISWRLFKLSQWPLSQWCYLTISSTVTPFFSCPQSFPASGSFPVSWLFASAGQSILQLQHQSFQWIFRVDFLWDWLVWSPCCPRDSQESSPASRLESINSVVSSLLYGPTLNLHMTTGKTISCMLEKMPKGNLKI